MRRSTRATFPGLNAADASAYARVALANVATEFPNKLDHVLDGPQDARTPRALHPVFYGSYDWHSSVHMHWLLARVLRRYPAQPEAGAIVARLDEHFAPEAVAVECAYLDRASSRAFERPYGWAWVLALQTELARGADSGDGADQGGHAAALRGSAHAAGAIAGDAVACRRDAWARWRDALAPLADRFAQRFEDFLPRADYPIRVGTHFNTAFALLLALDHAERCGRPALAACCRERARAWHAGDRDCPVAYEPSLDEYLSPGLVVAALMARVLDAGEARAWLDRFLPRRNPAALHAWLVPPTVADRTDPKLAHLDGLALSRAWCMRRLIAAGVLDDATAVLMHAAIDAHLAHGLPQVAGGSYMGEHWLASFAVLAQDDI